MAVEGARPLSMWRAVLGRSPRQFSQPGALATLGSVSSLTSSAPERSQFLCRPIIVPPAAQQLLGPPSKPCKRGAAGAMEGNGEGGVPLTGGAVFDKELYGGADVTGYAAVAADLEEDDVDEREAAVARCVGRAGGAGMGPGRCCRGCRPHQMVGTSDAGAGRAGRRARAVHRLPPPPPPLPAVVAAAHRIVLPSSSLPILQQAGLLHSAQVVDERPAGAGGWRRGACAAGAERSRRRGAAAAAGGCVPAGKQASCSWGQPSQSSLDAPSCCFADAMLLSCCAAPTHLPLRLLSCCPGPYRPASPLPACCRAFSAHSRGSRGAPSPHLLTCSYVASCLRHRRTRACFSRSAS